MSEILFISTASRLLGMHPQTLRKYERLGLVRPDRTVGSMRLYSPEQIERLRFIKHLVDERGINLAGVQHLLAVADAVRRLRPLAAGDALSRRGGHRRLLRELQHLSEVVGLTQAGRGSMHRRPEA